MLSAKELGAAIKEYINEHGLKQKTIAEKSGFTVQTFNAVMNGQRKLEATEYFKVCDALGVSLDYFVRRPTAAVAEA